MNTFDFEFKIPLKREDLRSNEASNQYVVSEVFYSKELDDKIEECRLSVNEIGCDFILEHFGTIFSVLQNFNDLDFEVLKTLYNDVIVKELDQLYNTLSVVLDDEEFHSDLRIKMLNVTKMLLYVSIEFLKAFQEKIDKAYFLVINEKGKKNTKMMKLKQDHNWDWEENERRTLELIEKIIRLPLHRLWNEKPEEEFVRMVEDCCYNVLEKPSVTSLKMKPTREIIFEILGILIKNYNNAISCKVKIVQLLKLYEHLVVILAQAVLIFVEKYKCRSLVKELILEIIETEAGTTNYNQDGSSSRSFSNFIVEIAKQQPEIILPCVNLFIHCLTSDPYTMRICVLTVMAEIIVNVFKTEDLTDENKKMRDNFLKHLLDHILDVNVFVRCRVLKLWQAIYRHKVIPKSIVLYLSEAAIDRLQDKSSNVVKNAIQLITVMLEENLYGALLDAEPVKQNLKTIKSQLIDTEKLKNSPSVFKMWFYTRMDISDFIIRKIKESNTHDNTSDLESTAGNQNSESSDNNVISEPSEEEISKKLDELQAHVLKQEFDDIYECLSYFENKFIDRLKLLKSISDKVQYYEWILGNLCRKDVNVKPEIILRFALCEDHEDIKIILNEPVELEDIDDVEFNTQKQVIIYCEDYLRFIDTMSEAAVTIGELMMNRTSLEVLEAISFFGAAQQFLLTGAEEGVRNMLLLINSKEPGFKDAVKNVFKTLYLESKKENAYESAGEAVDKLIALLKKVTHEQKNALKSLIAEWVSSNDISPEFILVLWERYSKANSNTLTEDSEAAAVLISMYASLKPEIIESNIDLLTKYGLSSDNGNNVYFQKYTCLMLHSLFCKKNENGEAIKYSSDSPIIVRLNDLILEQFNNLDNRLYPELSLEVITIIYQLSICPDIICEKILKNLYKGVYNDKSNTDDEVSFNEEILARFILIVGQVAFCQWKYLENDVLEELKQKNTRSKAKEERKKSKSNSILKKNVTNNTTDNFEDDADALANERIAESVRLVCENELLYGETLLAKLSSIIVNICKNSKKYPEKKLRSAASLSLAKLMMISSEFCNAHIQLFVTMLEKAIEPEVKINLILAFGDLTFRFPNIIEPWTIYYYNRLRDQSAKVRRTALIVISHLITNEMVKVKSQMSDVALCLVDEDKEIKNHAHHLFCELSLKGNSLYNVLADIISRLSHPEHRPEEGVFQIVLKLLMSMITKDRHLESIVEKLCYRLRGAIDERQCIDLSYCLTLISYTERSFQKLLDNIACYADKLNYARVHKNFSTIISRCKKNKANKISEAVSELENKISIIMIKGIDNLEADFLKPPKTPIKTPLKTPGRPGSTVKTPYRSERKSRLRTAKKAMNFDSDEDE